MTELRNDIQHHGLRQRASGHACVFYVVCVSVLCGVSQLGDTK